MKEVIIQQPLRSDVKQVQFTGMQLGENSAGLFSLERGVVECCPDTVDHQRVDLVFHQ